jgi:hypothetical protein
MIGSSPSRAPMNAHRCRDVEHDQSHSIALLAPVLSCDDQGQRTRGSVPSPLFNRSFDDVVREPSLANQEGRGLNLDLELYEY